MREIAAELGLGQEDVARRLGYTQPRVSAWYRGETVPPLVLHIFSCASCRTHFLGGAALTTNE